jgi:hypothetical protein
VVHKVRNDLGIDRLVIVSAGGMISIKAIAELRETDGIDWITVLKSASIHVLVEQGQTCSTDATSSS